jgi:hypothetical protein
MKDDLQGQAQNSLQRVKRNWVRIKNNRKF